MTLANVMVPMSLGANGSDHHAQRGEHLLDRLGLADRVVTAEAERMDEATFLSDPLQSNRIRINGRPLEDWLGAQSATSACSGCFFDNTQCRTVALGGKTYEAIPAGLIVRAGLLAAGKVLPEDPSTPAVGTPFGLGGDQ